MLVPVTPAAGEERRKKEEGGRKMALVKVDRRVSYCMLKVPGSDKILKTLDRRFRVLLFSFRPLGARSRLTVLAGFVFSSFAIHCLAGLSYSYV